MGQRVPSARQSPVQGRWNGEASLGQFQGRSHDLLEGHRAVELERGQPGVCRCRSNRAERSQRQLSARMLVEIVDAGLPGPPAQAADLHRLLFRGVMDDYGGDTAKAGVLGQRHVQGYAGGDSGVGRVASLFQDAVPRRRCEVVACRDHVSGPGNQWPVGADTSGHGAPPWWS